MRALHLALLLTATTTSCQSVPEGAIVRDVVVYGGTSAGVIAAVQVARLGRSVVLLEPTRHLGGLTSGGLGATDTGNKAVIGGLSREFYRRLKTHYDSDEAWRQQKKAEFSGYHAEADAIWTFEPRVAEQVFRAMLREAKVEVLCGERLDLDGGVTVAGGRITTIRMESGRLYFAKVFVDATYEGDLMAKAGVTYTVGRESNEQYGETLNGVQTKRATKHQFRHPVDPFVVPGDPQSGVLPGLHAGPPGVEGAADKRVQAYCFRMCMTDDPDNRVPFPKPAGYDPRRYELLLRYVQAGFRKLPMNPVRMPNRKTDTNNNEAFSTDNIGMNYAYPDGDYATRAAIVAEHETYQKGLMWFLANDPRLPEEMRQRFNRWGLAKDEFVDNGNWPHQLYIREARRMVGDHVHTELHCRRQRAVPEPVAMGSYNMDSHNVQRYVDADGNARNEGDIQVSPGGPYQISYRALVPRRQECTNLLVPVCLSATHAAYGSIRMEPVFMALGHAAADAAVQAIAAGGAVQDVDYARLREGLVGAGQVVEFGAPRRPRRAPDAVPPESLSGVVLDDAQAKLVGSWTTSTSVGPFVGTGYRHDGAAGGGCRATFATRLPAAGRYEVRFAYTPHANRARRVQVTVDTADGPQQVVVDQTKRPTHGAFVVLGTWRFAAEREAAVTLTNEGAGGHVLIDAVQFLPR